jgi:TfoX N-terminal domain
LFEPFGSITVKRVFGGAGVYADGLCFAVESKGEVFLKTDALSRADFFRRLFAVYLCGERQSRGRHPTGACRRPLRGYGTGGGPTRLCDASAEGGVGQAEEKPRLALTKR